MTQYKFIKIKVIDEDALIMFDYGNVQKPIAILFKRDIMNMKNAWSKKIK